MSEDRHDPFYVTPPPQHSMPWSGWVNYVLASREKRLRHLEREILAQAREMERRRILLEQRGAMVRRWTTSWLTLNLNSALVVFGVLYLILSWLITGEFPRLDHIIMLLRSARPDFVSP